MWLDDVETATRPLTCNLLSLRVREALGTVFANSLHDFGPEERAINIFSSDVLKPTGSLAISLFVKILYILVPIEVIL